MHYGDDGTISWGYNVPLNVDAVEWFKLLLLNDEDMKDHIRTSPQIMRAKEQLRRLNKTPVEAVTDYLRLLWEHVLACVTKELGQVSVKRTPFHVVLTVPAIWKSYASAKMREAARRAGITADRECGATTLKFITEPESAARATLADMGGRRIHVEDGDAITVVDCGGGTADLISYTIENAEPMSVSECVEGTGGLCGAIFLDQDFEALLKKKIGEPLWSSIPPADLKRMINLSWEHCIKQQFEGQTRDWTVDLPYQLFAAMQSGQLELKHEEIVKVFDNVMGQIEKLVKHQVDQVKEKLGKYPKVTIIRTPNITP
jgi:hypothetical protein